MPLLVRSMASKPSILAFLAGAAMILSGCMAGQTSDTDASDSETWEADAEMPAESALPGFQVDMKGCREGGGVSLYNSEPGDEGPADPLTRADISEVTGNPKIASYFQPITSDHVTGIWHISVYCEEYSLTMPGDSAKKMTASHDHEQVGEDDHHGELWWGWVGVRIDPPPWDESGIEHQFFIPDLSFLDRKIVMTLQEHLLLHASLMLEGKIDWVGPAAIHQVMDDEDHGVFQTHADMEEYKDFDIERMRFWMYVDMSGNFNHGGHGHDESEDGEGPHYMPVAIDLVNHGGGKHYTAVDGTAFLSHTRTNHHGPAGGAAGNTGAVLFEGFDRTLTIGPMPDVHLEDTWLH